MGDLIIKPFDVTVFGFGTYVYFATSRGRALADAFNRYCSYRDDLTFKEFLAIAKAKKSIPSERFGEVMTVAGQPAFFVDCNSQYIRFVRPGSDIILSSHPYDVLPIEVRRGTPYYASPSEPVVPANEASHG